MMNIKRMGSGFTEDKLAKEIKNSIRLYEDYFLNETDGGFGDNEVKKYELQITTNTKIKSSNIFLEIVKGMRGLSFMAPKFSIDQNTLTALLPLIDDTVLNDKEVGMFLADKCPEIFEYLPKEARNNLEVIQIAINKKPFLFQFLNEQIMNDKDFILKNILSLEYLPERFKNDPDVAFNAVNQAWEEMELVSTELKDNHDFMRKVASIQPDLFDYASDRLKADPHYIDDLVKHRGSCIRFASKKLQGNRDIATHAIKSYPKAFHYLSKELQADRDLVLMATKGDPNTISSASQEIQTRVSNQDPVKYLEAEIFKESLEKSLKPKVLNKIIHKI